MYCFFTGKYENVLRFIPRNERYMPTLNSLSNKWAGNNKQDFWSLDLLEAIQGITLVSNISSPICSNFRVHIIVLILNKFRHVWESYQIAPRWSKEYFESMANFKRMRGFNCGCTFHFILTLLYKFEKSGRRYLILGPKLVSALVLNRCQLSALNFCLSDNLHQHRWSSYAGNLLPIAYHPEICQANGYWGEFLKINSCLNLISGSSKQGPL